MKRSLKQALAVSVLFALSSSWWLGWSVAVHLAEDHGHREAPDDTATSGLELALHGHTHSDETPAHGHPFVVVGAALLPGKLFLSTEATAGISCELVFFRLPDCRRLSQVDPTHDPPPCPEAGPVLRI